MAAPVLKPEELRAKLEQLSQDITLLRSFVHGDEDTTVPLGEGEGVMDTNSLRRFMMLARDGVNGPIARAEHWALQAKEWALEGGGTVQTVNGIAPDEHKNVQLTRTVTQAEYDALKEAGELVTGATYVISDAEDETATKQYVREALADALAKHDASVDSWGFPDYANGVSYASSPLSLPFVATGHCFVLARSSLVNGDVQQLSVNGKYVSYDSYGSNASTNYYDVFAFLRLRPGDVLSASLPSKGKIRQVYPVTTI